MPFYSSGYLVTLTKELQGEPRKLETTVTQPSGTQVDVTVVQEAQSGDITYTQGDVGDGTNRFTITGFADQTSNVYVDIQLSSSDGSSTPVVDVVRVESRFDAAEFTVTVTGSNSPVNAGNRADVDYDVTNDGDAEYTGEMTLVVQDDANQAGTTDG